MKPDLDRILEVAAAHLLREIAPSLDTSYAQSNANVLAMLLLHAKQELERAAARRVEENDALRRLFADAVPVVTDPELRAHLEAASRGADPSLLVSALEETNACLRRLLIELHIHVEDLDSEAAHRVDAAIWAELVTSTERRRTQVGPL